jgi:hypothetical protein
LPSAKLGAPVSEHTADSPQKTQTRAQSGTECGTIADDPMLRAVIVAWSRLTEETKEQIAAIVAAAR